MARGFSNPCAAANPAIASRLQSTRLVGRVAILSFGGSTSDQIMFQFIGSILDVLFMVGFGSLAFFRPRQLASREGTPEEIERRVRLLKRCGAVVIVCGIGLFVFKLVA